MYTASIHTISYIIILSYKSSYIWHEIDAVTEPQIPADMVEYRMNCSVLRFQVVDQNVSMKRMNTQ